MLATVLDHDPHGSNSLSEVARGSARPLPGILSGTRGDPKQPAWMQQGTAVAAGSLSLRVKHAMAA